MLYEKAVEFGYDPNIFFKNDQTKFELISIQNYQIALIDGSSVISITGCGIMWLYSCSSYEHYENTNFVKNLLPHNTKTEVPISEEDIHAILERTGDI